MRVAIPLIIVAVMMVTLIVVLSPSYSAKGVLYNWKENRSFKKHKAVYLSKHPLHSGSEPIIWTCECSHPDNSHDKMGCSVEYKSGAQCACNLTPRQVRERY